MTEITKSESPDEFLKRNNLAGYDESVLESSQRPTIDLSSIEATNQPKENGSATPCKKCDNE